MTPPDDIVDAVETIDMMIYRWPFTEAADRANALAMLLTPGRAATLVAGGVPTFAVSSPTANDGAADLCRAVGDVHQKVRVTPAMWRQHKTMIPTAAAAELSFLWFTDARGVLRSPTVAEAAMSGSVQQRSRSGSRTIPCRTVFAVEGRDLRFDPGVAHCFAPIRLDGPFPGVPRRLLDGVKDAVEQIVDGYVATFDEPPRLPWNELVDGMIAWAGFVDDTDSPLPPVHTCHAVPAVTRRRAAVPAAAPVDDVTDGGLLLAVLHDRFADQPFLWPDIAGLLADTDGDRLPASVVRWHQTGDVRAFTFWLSKIAGSTIVDADRGVRYVLTVRKDRLKRNVYLVAVSPVASPRVRGEATHPEDSNKRNVSTVVAGPAVRGEANHPEESNNPSVRLLAGDEGRDGGMMLAAFHDRFADQPFRWPDIAGLLDDTDEGRLPASVVQWHQSGKMRALTFWLSKIAGSTIVDADRGVRYMLTVQKDRLRQNVYTVAAVADAAVMSAEVVD